jgi:hypothetical protein
MESIVPAIQAFIAPFSPLYQNQVQQEEATLPAMLMATTAAASAAVMVETLKVLAETAVPEVATTAIWHLQPC